MACAYVQTPPHPAPPDGPRLVILVATEQRLSNPAQSRLGLETIFPGSSGLEAFATTHTPARRP